MKPVETPPTRPETDPYSLTMEPQLLPGKIRKWSESNQSQQPVFFDCLLSSAPALSVTGDLTLSAWIKPASNTAATQYDIVGNGTEPIRAILLAQYGAELRLYLNSSSNYVASTNASLATGTMYHVMATYIASTASVSLYLNGTKLTTTTTGTIPTSINSNSGQFQIGAKMLLLQPAL